MLLMYSLERNKSTICEALSSIANKAV